MSGGNYKMGGGKPSIVQQMLNNPPVRRRPNPQQIKTEPPAPRERFMRLRGKVKILQNAYLQNGEIVERDADVSFICSDGVVKAHKVILLTFSVFFNELFQDQKGGEMTSVVLPSVSVEIMRLILLLAYRDSVSMTKREMREVALHLPLFSVDLKNFVFDDSAISDIPQTSNTNTNNNVSQMTNQLANQLNNTLGQKVGVKRPPLPQLIKQAANRPVPIAPRQIGSITISSSSLSSSGGGVPGKNVRLIPLGQPKKPLPILPKSQPQQQPMGLTAAQLATFRRIAPKPTPPLLPSSPSLLIQPAMNMVVGSQEIKFDDTNDEDDGHVPDHEQGRMIQEWMQNVGGEEMGSSNESRHTCLICNTVFEDPVKWRWHETHHVGLGIYKCEYCDELFSTSRKVYQHEMMEHGVAGASLNLVDEPPSIPSDFQILNNRKRYGGDSASLAHHPTSGPKIQKLTLVRTPNGLQMRRVGGGASGFDIKRRIVDKYRRGPSGGRGTSIKIGTSEGSDLYEERKIKQLHWVYVCSKCENCSDSMGKAKLHYDTCYEDDKSEPFERCVTKHRQGFYGKSKCPLCPRSYTTNHGFTIHTGHQHNEYRRKFNHLSGSDSLVCVVCKAKFGTPLEFHGHLEGDDGECRGGAEAKWIGNETPGERSPPSRKGGSRSETPPISPAQSKLNAALARSKRLANRRTLNLDEEPPSEEKFKEAECSICGKIPPNLADHINREHDELEMRVRRTSDTALRCLKCGISFGIPDLISHDTFGCIRSKRLREAKSSSGTYSIPEDVGKSPIDSMSRTKEELLCKETLTEQMKCPVCGRISEKLNIISDCLKTHGIHRCALCFNTYSDRSDYSTHIKQCHTLSNGKLACPFCDRNQFVNAGQVAGHMYSYHWEKLFKEILGERKNLARRGSESGTSPGPGTGLTPTPTETSSNNNVNGETEEETSTNNNHEESEDKEDKISEEINKEGEHEEINDNTEAIESNTAPDADSSTSTTTTTPNNDENNE